MPRSFLPLAPWIAAWALAANASAASLVDAGADGGPEPASAARPIASEGTPGTPSALELPVPAPGNPRTVASTTPRTPRQLADSAWMQELWSIELGYRQGLEFGDLLSEEQDMAERVDLRDDNGREVSKLVQVLGLGIDVWRRISPEFALGAGARSDWHLIVAGGNTSSSVFPLVLSARAATLQGRAFLLRRLNWEIGLQAGAGPLWGTLERYPLEESVDDEFVEPFFDAAHKPVDVRGWRGEAGATMHVRIIPRAGLGGSILVARDSWRLEGDDPLDAPRSTYPRPVGFSYPNSLIQYSVVLDLHADLRF